jgi:hypothetical protein
MTMHTWIRKLFPRATPRSIRKIRVREPLRLELLESRLSPSATPTATAVTPVETTINFGVPAAVTAAVSSDNGVPPDGSVQFLVNGVANGDPVPLAADGTAQIQLNEAAGIYQIAAEYQGDADYAATTTDAETPATLIVEAPPSITSNPATTFTAGTFGTFTITTSPGFPTTTALIETDTLPSGVTFVDNGDGTATLSGTPEPVTGNYYPIAIIATNGVSPDFQQTFGLTVDEAPGFTSDRTTTFTVGVNNSFSVSTIGYPFAALTATGTLPDGVTFVDNGLGLGTLSGTPAAKTGEYVFTLSADNGSGTVATQTFNLTVIDPPTFSNTASTATFTVGKSSSFAIATSPGLPFTTTVTEQGTLPAGLQFKQGPGGKATISGTPKPGSGGTYMITLVASNGDSQTTQTETLTVDEAPAFIGSTNATFTVGEGGTFAVRTTGYPYGALVVDSGTLPAGLQFIDNGDGTGEITGVPAVGSDGTFTIDIIDETAPVTGLTPQIFGNKKEIIKVQVTPPLVINSAEQVSFTVGKAQSFNLTTNLPADQVTWSCLALPSGLKLFAPNKLVNAWRIAGTPTKGTGSTAGKTYRVLLAVGLKSSSRNSDGQTLELTIFEPGGASRDSTDANARGASATRQTTSALTNSTQQGNQSDAMVPSAATVPPTITSNPNTTFLVGVFGDFTITTDQSLPTPAFTEQGALPAGVTFIDNGDGTATLSGTPAAGGADYYGFTIIASNGVGPSFQQTFALNVDDAPFTSDRTMTFTVGVNNSFTVTTAGLPISTLTATGTLPEGVTFVDNSDGTGTLSGTPAAETGEYVFTLSAYKGTTAAVTQTFNLTVIDPPTFSNTPGTTTFTVGQSSSFAIATSPGLPFTTTVTEQGTLPAGLHFKQGPGDKATISGTPKPGSGGTYTIALIASNGVSQTTQTETLTVDEPSDPPTFSNTPSTATFTVGQSSSFAIATVPGQPLTTTVTEQGTLPAGLHFKQGPGGKATISGTPKPGSGGTYTITLIASNPDSQTTQTETLTVDEPPAFTGSTNATFTVGEEGTFAVKTTGYPYGHLVMDSGTLPAGLQFIDNGDGTGEITGVPAVGSDGTFTIEVIDETAAGTAITPQNGGNKTETIKVQVSPPVVITSAEQASFTVGKFGNFDLTTNLPANQVKWTCLALPSGLKLLAPNAFGNGWRITGTPTKGTGSNVGKTYLVLLAVGLTSTSQNSDGQTLELTIFA